MTESIISKYIRIAGLLPGMNFKVFSRDLGWGRVSWVINQLGHYEGVIPRDVQRWAEHCGCQVEAALFKEQAYVLRYIKDAQA